MTANHNARNPDRLPHSAARIEFIAIINKIVELLNVGYSQAGIWRKLTEEQEITMCLRTFHGLCAKRLKKSDDPAHPWEPAIPPPRKNAKKKPVKKIITPDKE